MWNVANPQSDESKIDQVGLRKESKSWFSVRKAPSMDATQLETRDDSEDNDKYLSSHSTISYGITQTFSTMIGLSPEPTRTRSMRSEERDDATFDVFMNDEKSILEGIGKNAVVPKLPVDTNKKDATAHASALACISDKNFKKFLQIVKNNPSILSMKTIKAPPKLKGFNGGTLLHVLASLQPKKRRESKTRNFTKRGTKSVSSTTYIRSSLPDDILKFVIKTCPEALEMKDDEGRLPIHCACISQALYLEDVLKLVKCSPSKFQVMDNNVIRLLLKGNPDCAAVVDNKGNLPLHYAAKLASPVVIIEDSSVNETYSVANYPCGEDAVRRLLAAYPNGVAVLNKKKMMPIHCAATMGQNVNTKILSMLLEGHKSLGVPPTERNEDGDPPLYVALKSGATCEAIQCFAKSEHSSRIFIQRDSANNNALHIALQSQYPDVALVRDILNIAPFTASSPNSNGIMPLKTASQLRLPTDLIRSLFTRDMPIEIGAPKNRSVTPLKYKFYREKSSRGTSSRQPVVRRSHHHSWWYLLVECNDYYLDTVYEFLLEEATHFQIVALARQIGPDGKSIMINCVTDRCRAMFHSLLRFYDRYEILLSTNELEIRSEDIVDGVQTFLALDHGALPPVNGSAYADLINHVPYFSNTIKVDHESDIVETSLLPENEKKVLLRTYFYEEAFYAELKVRQKYVFDPSQFENIYNYHNGEHFSRLALSKSDKLCGITFERPAHSMVDVFSSVSGSVRSQKWIDKCWVVLKQIAVALKALHDQNLVHGHLVPSNVCKYGNVWKLAQLGTVIPINTPMRGTFRSCVPPESIFINETKSKTVLSSVDGNLSTKLKTMRGVKFSSWALDEGKERKPSRIEKQEEQVEAKINFLSPQRIFGWKSESSSATKEKRENILKDDSKLSFHPERITTKVSWDMWGFGLIMVQLLTGRCTQLSNFEKAPDAVMKKLYIHDDRVLTSICEQLYNTVGKEAADLVMLLLQRDPVKRPISMNEVLEHPYFRSSTIYV